MLPFCTLSLLSWASLFPFNCHKEPKTPRRTYACYPSPAAASSSSSSSSSCRCRCRPSPAVISSASRIPTTQLALVRRSLSPSASLFPATPSLQPNKPKPQSPKDVSFGWCLLTIRKCQISAPVSSDPAPAPAPTWPAPIVAHQSPRRRILRFAQKGARSLVSVLVS